MTLTQELNNSASPVRQFIDSCFVISPAEVKRGLPKPLRDRLSTVLLPAPEEIPQGALGTIGTAFDYRVRLTIEGLPEEPLAAHMGAALLVGGCDATLKDGRIQHVKGALLASYGLVAAAGLTPELVREFFDNFARLASQRTPAARRGADDTTLAQYCLTLALLEQVYRAATMPDFDSTLLHLPEGATLDDLIALASPAQVFDVDQLWRGFSKEVQWEGQAAVCNPRFAGSRDVGGADADLILDGCLVELKVTKRPPNLAQYLRQLLGYVLLDYKDAYSIRSIGVYAARQQTLLTFSLHELLIAHIARQDGGLIIESRHDGEATTVEERLRELRPAFKRLLARSR